MKADIAEIFQTQEEIIRLQSQIIDKLFLRLLQHESAEELDNSDEVKLINEVAKLKT